MQGAQGNIVENSPQGASQKPEESEAGVENPLPGGPAIPCHFRQGGLDGGLLGPHADSPKGHAQPGEMKASQEDQGSKKCR